MTSRADRRQERKDAVIRALHHGWTVAPSFRDISEWCHLPLSTTYEICETLRDEGRLTFTDGIARSIRLVTE